MASAYSAGELLAPVVRELITRSSTYNNTYPNGETFQQYEQRGRYYYVPSNAAAIVFTVLYAIIVASNLFQFFYYRAWFWWSMNLAVLLEFVGYIFRIISVHKVTDKGPFIVQTVLILVAPAVMAAACYQGFGRLVLWVLPPQLQSARVLWLPARRITPLFVGFDVVSFFVQCVGGAVVASASSKSKINLGRDIVLIGLGLQLCTFGFFVVSSLRFTLVLTKIRPSDSGKPSSHSRFHAVNLPTNTRWRLFVVVINVASILILVRSVYRFVEYAISTHNYLSDHEWTFYVLDAALIFICAVGFVLVHPGNYLPYLKLRRRRQEFSRNVGKGPFSGLARWQGESAPLRSAGSEYPMTQQA